MELVVKLLMITVFLIMGATASYFIFYIMLPVVWCTGFLIGKLGFYVFAILTYPLIWIPLYIYETIRYYFKLQKLKKDLIEVKSNNAGELTISCYKHRIEEHKKNKPVLF